MSKSAAKTAKTVALMPGYATKECPRCEKEKDIDTEFGYRLSKGKIIAQSWCRACRGLSAILGPGKSWADLSERAAKEKAQEKRDFMRKPKKEKTAKDNHKECKGQSHCQAPAAVAPKTPKNTARAQVVKGGQAPKNTPPASLRSAPPKAVSTPAGNMPEKTQTVEELKDTIWITADQGTTKVLFKKHFPKDEQIRSWKTMVERLMAKLGDRAKLTPTAKERLGV